MSDSSLRSKLEITCRNCSLTALCIPRGLTEAEIELIGGIVGRRKTLNRGDYLYRAGERFRGILAVKSGSAKTVAEDGQGREYMTGLMLPGELLGFDALATDVHKCSAVALETLSYCELPADRLDELCERVPNLLRELFRHAGARLDEETAQAITTRQPAEERVAAFLLNLSERLESRGFSPVDFRLSLTRQEIGNYLGLALETVSRVLQGLQAAGLISIRNRDVRILDRQALRGLGGRPS